MQMVPQYFPPRFFGFLEEEATLDEDYCTRVLAAICQTVVHRAAGRVAEFPCIS